MRLILLLIIAAALSSCKKDDPITPTTGTVTFYTTVGGSWNLLVDDKDRGEIDQALLPPLCEQAGFITLLLSTGIHTYDLKSNDGLAWGSYKEIQVAAGCSVFRALY